MIIAEIMIEHGECFVCVFLYLRTLVPAIQRHQMSAVSTCFHSFHRSYLILGRVIYSLSGLHCKQHNVIQEYIPGTNQLACTKTMAVQSGPFDGTLHKGDDSCFTAV